METPSWLGRGEHPPTPGLCSIPSHAGVCEEGVFPTPPLPLCCPMVCGFGAPSRSGFWRLSRDRDRWLPPCWKVNDTCQVCPWRVPVWLCSCVVRAAALGALPPPPISPVERAGWTGRCWRFLPAHGTHPTGILEHLLWARPSSGLWGCSRDPSPAPTDLALTAGDTQ